MSLSMFTVVVDCADPYRVADFWSEALGWVVNERNTNELQLVNPDAAGTSLYFMRVPEPKVGKNRLHLDLLAPGPMEPEVQRLIRAGAQLVEVHQDPPSMENPDSWTVMRDPEGNEFCVTSRQTLTGWQDGVAD
jgi:predicted enzyme related to lactoylglutathione lyase